MRSFLVAWAAVLLLAAPAMAAEPADQAVAQQVAQRLKSSGQLEGYSIGVKAQGGTVWLRGEVSSAAQATSAIRLARSTPKVRQVVNNLTVRSRPASDSGVSPSAYNEPAPPAAVPPRVARRAQIETGEIEGATMEPGYVGGGPLPMAMPGVGGSIAPAYYDQPNLPNYAWPTYAAYPNYAAVTYPKQYSASAWPYIGPFYPYPQVPPGWRKVTLEWDDGWWMLDFQD